MISIWFRFSTFVVGLAVVLGTLVALDLTGRGLHRHPADPRWPLGMGEAPRGREAMIRYGCGACHVIPGVRLATGRVGPKLEDFTHQMYIAGVLANTPENLIAWLQDPQQHNPRTAMPNLQVTEEDAEDMAAYLYTVP
jgi:cytochrome c